MPDSVHLRHNRSTIIISREKIEEKTDLYSIDMSANLLVNKNLAAMQKGTRYKYKIVAKRDSSETDLDDANAICNNMLKSGSVCTDWYLVTTDDETGNILSVEYLYTICSSGGSGNGGGGGNGEIIATILIDSIQNSCISSAYSLISANAPGVINSLLSDLGDNQKYLININDSWTGGSISNPAQTLPIYENNQIVGYNIELDGSIVSQFSKELITEIIYHEVVHAWLSVNYYSLGQHSIMLNTLLTDLVSCVQQIYPQYSTQDAYANALFGLSNLLDYSNDPNAQQDITTFNQGLQAQGLTIQSMTDIYLQFAEGDNNGTKQGTRCK